MKFIFLQEDSNFYPDSEKCRKKINRQMIINRTGKAVNLLLIKISGIFKIIYILLTFKGKNFNGI